MKNNLCKRKCLTGAVILLFIGLAFAPSITADLNKSSMSNDKVEIIVEFFGINDVKSNSIFLTEEKANDLDELFEEFKRKLNDVDSKKEAIRIFNEMILELDKNDLLGELSIEEAQRIVTGAYEKMQPNGFFEELFLRNSNVPIKHDNIFCLISGETEYQATFERTLWYNLYDLFYNFKVENKLLIELIIFFTPWRVLVLLGLTIAWIFFIIEILFEPILKYLEFRKCILIGNGPYSAKGWVKTFGLFGYKSTEGEFYGDIHTFGKNYLGVIGFSGIHYSNDREDRFLGHAFQVKLTNTCPEDYGE